MSELRTIAYAQSRVESSGHLVTHHIYRDPAVPGGVMVHQHVNDEPPREIWIPESVWQRALQREPAKADDWSVEEIRECIAEINPEALTADGFDAAIVGYVERFGQPPLVLYDREACIESLMRDNGGDREAAVEYFEFNTIGAWVGDHTPAFATILRRADDPETDASTRDR